jgi:CrcB protein
MIKDLLFIGIGGFAGSILRYLIYLSFANRNLTIFPYATLVINLVGCLAIGVVSVMIEKAVPQSRSLYLVVSVGLLGGFTTFSAFGLETLNLIENQQTQLALLNILANVLLGLAAVWIGRFLMTT